MSKTVSLVRRMAIVGNVCVGKTCLFDRLCAAGEHSINIPGSTTQSQRGVLSEGPCGANKVFRHQCATCASHAQRRFRSARVPGPCFEPGKIGLTDAVRCPALKNKDCQSVSSPVVTQLYDTPGSATLAANNQDEMVGRDLILSGMVDSVLLVADAKNIRRSLALALELTEFGLPMIIDLNMLDEAEAMGLEIDNTELTRILGVSVTRTVAVENIGLRGLAEIIVDAQTPNRVMTYPETIENALQMLFPLLANSLVDTRGLGLLLLCGDQGARDWIRNQLGEQVLTKANTIVQDTQALVHTPLKQFIADCFFVEAGAIADRVVVSKVRSFNLLVRFGRWAQQPISGTLIGFAVLALAYYWVGVFGAGYVVDHIATRFFQSYLLPWCGWLVNFIPSAFVRDALMNPDFGLLPTGLFLALGVVMPVLFCFYLLQAVLEDSGYLPRLAVLFDRFFRKIGLNGQGFIPLILAFSCVTMSVITTRMLPSRKERTILTLLVVGIPCAPLLGVMFVILAPLPLTAMLLIFCLIFTRIVVAGWLASKIISGQLPDLILEIPRMRIPRLHILWNKTWRRTWQFVEEATPVFLVASFAVFLFNYVGGLAVIEKAAQPFINGVLGLPTEAVRVLIKTCIRRENGATELNLLRNHFTPVQLVVTLIVMTFLMPCINSMIVIIKERGLKTCVTILAIASTSAVLIGAAVNLGCKALGVTFN